MPQDRYFCLLELVVISDNHEVVRASSWLPGLDRQYMLTRLPYMEWHQFVSLHGEKIATFRSASKFYASLNRLILGLYLRLTVYASFNQAVLGKTVGVV